MTRSVSAEYNPCFVFARRIRSKPSAVLGPVLLPPCIWHRLFRMAGAWHGLPFRLRAPQRGTACASGSVVCQSGRRSSGCP
jgi:hypothetical protein